MNRRPASDETDIIKECLNSDRDRFAELVERYRNMAYTIAYRMLGDGDQANDAAQEGFIAAYTNLRSFQFGSKFSTWLASIVLNKCRDQLRSRRDQVPMDDIAAVHPDPGKDPEQIAAAEETRDRLQTALDRLPADYREVLVLKHLQELDYEELSGILHASVTALKVRAHRGREMLRTLLEQAGGSHG